MTDKLIIFGCGGHAKAVLDVVLYNGEYKEIIFVDENAKENETILDFPVIKNYTITKEDVFIAVGNNEKRMQLGKKYYKNLVSIVSKKAYIGKNVTIGKGVFVAHNAQVGIMSRISDFCIINSSASLVHECVLAETVFIGPNTTLCGKVHIGNNSFIGASATIIDNIKINKNITIGASTVVIKDLIKEGIYVGNPARFIK